METRTMSTAIALAGIALLLGGGCTQRKAEDPAAEPAAAAPTKEEAQVPVSVTAVRPLDLIEKVEVTGTLMAAKEATVGTRGAGRVEWVKGKEGTPVRRGEVIARLDTTDAKIQVRSAEAAVTAARARLEQAKAAAAQQVTATGTGIQSAQAQVQSAQAAVEASKARLQQAITSADALEASTQAQIKVAKAALDAAASRLEQLKNGARNEEKLIAEQRVKIAEATYTNKKANYDRLKRLYDNGGVSKAQLDLEETQLRVAEAQLDAEKQQWSLVKIGARPEEISQAEAAVRQAEQGLAVAGAGLKQVEAARDAVAIARTDIAQTKAGLDAAKAGLETAKASRQIDIMRDKDVLAAQAGIQQAKEALAAALQMLDNTMVYAPVDGVVQEKMCEVGETVGMNDPIMRISTTQSLYFEAQLSELEAGRLKSGQPAILSVDALEGNRANMYGARALQGLSGVVEQVVPVVDKATRNFRVRILVPRQPRLFPGMFARGHVVVNKLLQVIGVPKDALVQHEGRQTVFTVSADGHARLRPVVLGASDGRMVQVLSGLARGEQIVTVGQQSLADGDPVKVVGNGASTPAP